MTRTGVADFKTDFDETPGRFADQPLRFKDPFPRHEVKRCNSCACLSTRQKRRGLSSANSASISIEILSAKCAWTIVSSLRSRAMGKPPRSPEALVPDCTIEELQPSRLLIFRHTWSTRRYLLIIDVFYVGGYCGVRHWSFSLGSAPSSQGIEE